MIKKQWGHGFYEGQKKTLLKIIDSAPVIECLGFMMIRADEIEHPDGIDIMPFSIHQCPLSTGNNNVQCTSHGGDPACGGYLGRTKIYTLDFLRCQEKKPDLCA